MDPMCPLPKKGDFLQGHTWTDCNYVLLTQATQFRTLHEGDKPVLGYADLSCFFAVWGRGWCNVYFFLYHQMVQTCPNPKSD